MMKHGQRSAAMRAAAAAAVCAMVVTGAIGAAAASGGTWGTAREMPGTAVLDQGEPAEALSVSCASAGNCAAAGFYTGSSRQPPFVASEVNGTWHSAIEVPGTATLNQGGLATALSVSCAVAGNCASVGYYMPSSGQVQAFVVNERPSQ